MSQLDTDPTITQPFCIVSTDKDGNINVSGSLKSQDGIILPNSGSTPATLDFYVPPTATTALTLGGALTGTTNAFFQRTGNQVTVKLAATLLSASSSATITLSGIPTIFRPNVTSSRSLWMTTFVLNNGTYTPGTAQISATDVSVLVLRDDTGANFTGTSGFGDLVFTWLVGV